MDDLIKWLAPVQKRLDETAVHVGFLAALAAYFCSLFFPWTTLPIVVAGHGGVWASGWDEAAYLAVLPFAIVLLNARPGRVSIDISVVGLCIMLAFVMLLVNNAANRTVWLTPMLIGGGSPVPFAMYGSRLAEGFWCALASMICLSFFSLLWTMQICGNPAKPAYSPGMSGQRA